MNTFALECSQYIPAGQVAVGLDIAMEPGISGDDVSA
jgi:hypothetical protein